MECMVTEPYHDFSELALRAEKDVDYGIRVLDRSASVTVAAIHAGCIEPLTGALAEAIAGDDCNLYLLCGLRAERGEPLRVPVTRFDDVRLTALMDRSVVGISLQGVPGGEGIVHLGGSNRRLRGRLQGALEAAGFATAGPASPLAAHSPARFVNRPSQGGVQIEVTVGLRRLMTTGPLEEASGGPQEIATSERFHGFVGAVRQGLAGYLADVDADLDIALQRFEESTRAIRQIIPADDNGHAGQGRVR